MKALQIGQRYVRRDGTLSPPLERFVADPDAFDYTPGFDEVVELLGALIDQDSRKVFPTYLEDDDPALGYTDPVFLKPNDMDLVELYKED